MGGQAGRNPGVQEGLGAFGEKIMRGFERGGAKADQSAPPEMVLSARVKASAHPVGGVQGFSGKRREHEAIVAREVDIGDGQRGAQGERQRASATKPEGGGRQKPNRSAMRIAIQGGGSGSDKLGAKAPMPVFGRQKKRGAELGVALMKVGASANQKAAGEGVSGHGGRLKRREARGGHGIDADAASQRARERVFEGLLGEKA